MSLSSVFARPLLLYDDGCGPCTKFAKAASTLSRGWIRTAGHHSQQAYKAKSAIFPAGYEAEKMFWLINSRGAFGARSGLTPLSLEIVTGWIKRGKNDDTFSEPTGLACSTSVSTLKRLATMLSHGDTFSFRSS